MNEKEDLVGYGLDDWGSIPAGVGMFLFTTTSKPALSPPSFLSSGYRSFFHRK